MDSKQIVSSGMVATALFTAIILSGWVADVVIAFFILALGIILTYFIALNQKRIKQTAHLWELIKASQEIRQQNSTLDSLEKLAGWSKRLLTLKYTMVQVPGEDGFEAGDTILGPLAALVQKRIGESQALTEFLNDESDAAWPQGVNWVAVYPLAQADQQKEYRTVLLLADVQPREFDRREQEVLNVLGQLGKDLLDCWQNENDSQREEGILVKSLLAGIEARDPVFLGHSERVWAVSRLIASSLSLDAGEMKALEYSAWLHDIGKTAEAVLMDNKDDGETVVYDHASLGSDFIPDTGIFKLVKEAVRHHHERYDGGGYPLGLRHTDIPFLARIIAVADIYDALTHLCPDEERINHHEAIQIIKKGTGTLFDPLVVVALEEVEAEIALYSDDGVHCGQK